jgi:hypothetical protein
MIPGRFLKDMRSVRRKSNLTRAVRPGWMQEFVRQGHITYEKSETIPNFPDFWKFTLGLFSGESLKDYA